MAGLTGNKLIARFIGENVRPRLGPDFRPYLKRDLVRMHGPFVELLALSFSRSHTLRVHPTFFVVGADLSLAVIPQNVSLEVLDPRSWSFPGATLDSGFGAQLVRRLESASPLSFVAPIAAADDAAIPRLFQLFDTRTTHWSPSLYLTHCLLSSGRAEASAALARARERFDSLGARITGDPPPWRLALAQWLCELEHRLVSPDGQDLCRADSERQANDLGLPEIVWR